MKKVKLEKISKSISSGITPLRSNLEYWDDGNIPWLKTEQLGEKYIYDTSEKITDYALENTTIKLNPINTLCIAMYGEGRTRGNISILKSIMTTNQACCNIVIDEDKADYEYIYYYLKTQYHQLRSLSSGVRKNLNSNDIKNFEIRLPKDIITQKKIAAVLSSLDDKIELNNRINSELENLAKTIYDYWFVQFDFPDENGTPYKSSGGKMVYNQELKREIPAGWEVKYIEDILEVEKKSIKIPTKEVLSAGQYPVVDQSTDYICGFTNKLESIIKVDRPRIIFGDHTRIVKLINFDFARGADGTQVLLSNNERLPQHFFYHTLLKVDLSNYGYARHFKFLKQSKILLPNSIISWKFEKIAAKSYEMIRQNIFQNQQLTQLRDWLLPMLMNGQITVK
ncbi:MAG: restriction endonuclease subunit S [Dolichospermum sp.]